MTPINEPREWEARFDEQFPFVTATVGSAHHWKDKPARDNIKAFISQELARAREEGRKQGYEQAMVHGAAGSNGYDEVNKEK